MAELALARALVTDPQVLFLDEPTANLDGRSTRQIEGILRDAISGGTKIILATHDMGQAQRLAKFLLQQPLYVGRLPGSCLYHRRLLQKPVESGRARQRI